MDAFMVGMWMQMYARLIVDNLGPPSIGETAKISLEISETYCEIQKKKLLHSFIMWKLYR